MKLARPEAGASVKLGSIPSPSTGCVGVVSGNADKQQANSPCKPPFGLSQVVDCNHLWVLDGKLVIRGMVISGREACELPWRRKKDNEPASQSEIARDLELVHALEIRGKIQTPKDFESTKLYLREDIK